MSIHQLDGNQGHGERVVMAQRHVGSCEPSCRKMGNAGALCLRGGNGLFDGFPEAHDVLLSFLHRRLRGFYAGRFEFSRRSVPRIAVRASLIDRKRGPDRIGRCDLPGVLLLFRERESMRYLPDLRSTCVIVRVWCRGRL